MSELYLQLATAVAEMDEERSAAVAQEILNTELNLLEAIEEGLVKGMSRAGDLFEAEEYFIPELLLCADAMDAAMDIWIPHIKAEERKARGCIVIGTVFGDTHDLGKNIVALLLKGAGYEVIDLGRDVSARSFVDAAMKYKADVIALSTLMTTTMDHMAAVLRLLEQEGKRELFKVILGGKPVSAAFAQQIGADAYCANAGAALRKVKEIMSQSPAPSNKGNA